MKCPVTRFFRNNGLSLVMFSLFFLFFIGQSVTGFKEYNDDRKDHKHPQISYGAYLQSAHFGEATMENWESEFLQMGLYVVLTAFLFQKGSAESKSIDGKNSVDEDPATHKKKNSPWPVKKGGIILRLYENSLSLMLLTLFLASFVMHAHFGAQSYNEDQLNHGGVIVTSLWGYMATSRFWFESFQNWQSEFFSIGAVVVLSIYLRQRGSPESKPVAMAHGEQDAA